MTDRCACRGFREDKRKFLSKLKILYPFFYFLGCIKGACMGKNTVYVVNKILSCIFTIV
jgi:hypothetical protein